MQGKLKSVMEKVAKLRALAERATTQAEAETAAAQAEALVSKYQLDEAQIEAAGEVVAEAIGEDEPLWSGARVMAPELDVAATPPPASTGAQERAIHSTYQQADEAKKKLRAIAERLHTEVRDDVMRGASHLGNYRKVPQGFLRFVQRYTPPDVAIDVAALLAPFPEEEKGREWVVLEGKKQETRSAYGVGIRETLPPEHAEVWYDGRTYDVTWTARKGPRDAEDYGEGKIPFEGNDADLKAAIREARKQVTAFLDGTPAPAPKAGKTVPMVTAGIVEAMIKANRKGDNAYGVHLGDVPNAVTALQRLASGLRNEFSGVTPFPASELAAYLRGCGGVPENEVAIFSDLALSGKVKEAKPKAPKAAKPEGMDLSVESERTGTLEERFGSDRDSDREERRT